MAFKPREARSGLGRPLTEVLARGAHSRSPLAGMLETDLTVVDVLLELLRQHFPGDLVVVYVQAEPGLIVTRVAGEHAEGELDNAMSSAASEVLRLRTTALLASDHAQLYAIPRSRHCALVVRRTGRVFSPDDLRYIDLVAQHVR